MIERLQATQKRHTPQQINTLRAPSPLPSPKPPEAAASSEDRLAELAERDVDCEKQEGGHDDEKNNDGGAARNLRKRRKDISEPAPSQLHGERCR